ncbi:uncharacterized protein [Rutidosis leptorrhynchoides]|uniref:uncharacterized protein n=1 Tax=Rutidosis leptorrhynchoides TaxID=125765 RepID=UPI003A99C989
MKPDHWKWNFTSDRKFTVKKLSTIIDDNTIALNNFEQETIRNNLVPKKLEVFVWLALKKRLSVRMELDKRGIDLHSVRCPICDDGLESMEHSLIFYSPIFGVLLRLRTQT